MRALPERLDPLHRPTLAAEVDVVAGLAADEVLGEVGLVGDHVLLRLALPGAEDGHHPRARATLEMDSRADAHLGGVHAAGLDQADALELRIEAGGAGVQVLV